MTHKRQTNRLAAVLPRLRRRRSSGAGGETPDRASQGGKRRSSNRRRGPLALLLRRRNVLAFAGLLALLGSMALGYACTLRSVRVDVDGRAVTVRTHLPTVGEALAEARIDIQPEDRVEPPLNTPARSGLHVRVQRARTINLTVDGKAQVHRSLALTVGEALTEAGIKWIPEDRIVIGSQQVPGDHPLYTYAANPRQASSRGARPLVTGVAPPPLDVLVQRAVPIGVQDGQVPYTFLTTARTLGEALLEKGIVIYAADRVDPPLETPIMTGLRAKIERSRPITLLADGQTRQTRTRATTVAELLQEEGLTLSGLDYTQPGTGEAIEPGARVVVVRVGERELTEEESIPYETQYRANPGLEIDQQQVDQWGGTGILKRSLKVRYENGVEVSRTVAREWVEKPPQHRVISYGTKIVLRQLNTPEGTFTYWRKLRALATAYTAATCGKTRSDPTYGITRLGWKARKGVIAVDPNAIPMLTQMYVPGYGPGTAADTGGMIKGLHIDLCYDEDNLVNWYKWTDVYLLGSPPPPDKIRWILPDYPHER